VQAMAAFILSALVLLTVALSLPLGICLVRRLRPPVPVLLASREPVLVCPPPVRVRPAALVAALRPLRAPPTFPARFSRVPDPLPGD
jgi:hypothetical protein